MPPVRLAPREELAAAARVAPLLRAAADLSRWADQAPLRFAGATLPVADSLAAAAALELTPAEIETAWQVMVATGLRDGHSGGADGRGGRDRRRPAPGGARGQAGRARDDASRLDRQDNNEVLQAWDSALAAILDAEELDGLATALYTVGAPVRIDALFEAYAAAASGPQQSAGGPAPAGPVQVDHVQVGPALVDPVQVDPVQVDPVQADPVQADPVQAGPVPVSSAQPGRGQSDPAQLSPAQLSPARPSRSAPREPDEAAALSRALETLADLGVVELGTEETAGGLTVALSPLGVWGVHRRLRSQGWHVPVLGRAGRDGAVGLLMTLASCDAEDGEAEIGTWLARRSCTQAARELIQAAAAGSPGLRGAAFAVLDRIGAAATPEVRAALTDPLLRAHAAVWLHEHDEEAELRPEDRTWLLVDLGAGLLEEADPLDVVAELLPEVSAPAQADIVAGLWRVDHPGVIGLLTALSDHHPDPGVARAARKAAFKARSPGTAGSASQGS